jgi:hypothetical protein
MKLEFCRQLFEKSQISTFIKIRLVGAELFHADRQTDGRKDMTKIIVAFRNYANAPKSSIIFPQGAFMCCVVFLTRKAAHNTNKTDASVPPAGFEPAIPAHRDFPKASSVLLTRVRA